MQCDVVLIEHVHCMILLPNSAGNVPVNAEFFAAVLLRLMVCMIASCMLIRRRQCGGYMTSAVVLYVLFSCVVGYVSATMYKVRATACLFAHPLSPIHALCHARLQSIGGEQWKADAVLTATVFPERVFAIEFI